jgi:hypothetical protein
MRRCAGAACVALLIALGPRVARAQEPPPPAPGLLPSRRANFSWDPRGTLLRASFSYRDVVDTEVQKKLQSGLPTVIVMRAYVYAENKPDTAVAGTLKSCRIAFDVWDEVYRLQISQPGGETTSVAVNLEGVLRRCADARDLPVVDKGLVQGGASYFITAMIEVNPISQEMLERIRRWVSRPPGSSNATPGDSLFGSFVGLFVARIGQAERTLTFRTQSVAVPQ